MDQQIVDALTNIGFANTEIHLEPTATGKVAGFLVSPRFAGMSQIERQEDLWRQLRSRLDNVTLSKVVTILTMTPDEIADDD